VVLRLLILAVLVAALYVGWLAWRRPPARLRRLDLAALGVGGPAVVQFTSASCGPCKAAAPRLAEAAVRAGVEFTQVDVGERPDIAREYGIRTLPTIVVTGRAGEVTGSWTALPGSGILDEAVRRAAG
jgi:thiol-disulfide isomerase/thioredoxin